MEQPTRLFRRSMGRWLMTLMLVMLSSLATKAQVEVRMGNVQGAPGETVRIPIYVDCEMDMRLFQMYFSTDLGVYFSEGEFTDRIDPSAYTGFSSINGLIMAVRVVSMDDVTLEAGDGLVAELSLDIPDDAQPGAYTMTLSNMQFVPSGDIGYDITYYPNDAHATLTVKGPEAYACYTPGNMTLTFYYDNQRSSRTGTTYDLNTGNILPGWYNDRTNVTKVVFDPSFAGVRPTTTFTWFFGMRNLQSIAGMSYLNTSEVTNMNQMFYSCDAMTSLDLSSFNTAKVTTMLSMFTNCSGLTSLDVSSFNTAKVTNMRSMFSGCSGLTSLDVSQFNTSKVTDMSYLFNNCCNLTTIYAGDGWNTDALTWSDNMFNNCSSLVGGKGTTYDASHVDAAYAHIDGGPSNPGYFTDKNASLRGDVDADGNVTISDVTALIDYLLSGNATGVNLTAADCDLSGDVTISDVTTLIDYLLSGRWN